jgi:hypothetical protein
VGNKYLEILITQQKRGTGRVARAFDLAGFTSIVGAPFLRVSAKGGCRKCRRQAGLRTYPKKIKYHTSRNVVDKIAKGATPAVLGEDASILLP